MAAVLPTNSNSVKVSVQHDGRNELQVSWGIEEKLVMNATYKNNAAEVKICQ